MDMALDFFAKESSAQKVLPPLPPEICDLIRKMNWMFCFKCGTEVIQEKNGLLLNMSKNYCVIKGYMLCFKCKA